MVFAAHDLTKAGFIYAFTLRKMEHFVQSKVMEGIVLNRERNLELRTVAKKLRLEGDNMNWLRQNKKEKDEVPKCMTPSEFLGYSVEYIHKEAAKKGFAKKGFILNEGLVAIGSPFISEGLASEPDRHKRTNAYYMSLAASNLQCGIVFARVLCTDKERIISGSFFNENEDVFELIYKEFLIALRDDLHMSFQAWDAFREFIIPKMMTLLEPYSELSNAEEYRAKVVSAYYLLGVSIGLEKYEL